MQGAARPRAGAYRCAEAASAAGTRPPAGRIPTDPYGTLARKPEICLTSIHELHARFLP
ncbi:hypothetical protein BN940_01581 [Castellaniella defragrans 65Phen]|uniref:Uncharacterized protein n=1 Tax=Castellaniella defragrans (strain DSM 12143 / CCUG 39792 / 65Phen) TaxID=1437824 RepID=W8WSY2_CASD6|nr:hypothetical protein BN940_01581 [Castellaniella defragrans 65Phen]